MLLINGPSLILSHEGIVIHALLEVGELLSRSDACSYSGLHAHHQFRQTQGFRIFTKHETWLKFRLQKITI
jgi:hypothetical protein